MMAAKQDTFQQAMNQGHSAAWEQQWDKAADYYRSALSIEPDHPAALASLGLALFELKQDGEALRVYQRAARITPTDPIPVEKMARINERLGKLSEAVQAGLQAAELQLKAQEVHKAVENWHAVLRLQPENLLARTRLGMVYDRMGRKAEAVAEYLAAASVVQFSGDLSKAVQLAEYAFKLAPESAEARKALITLKRGQVLPRPTGPGPLRQQAPGDPAANEALPAGPEAPQFDPIGEARQTAMTQLAAILFEQADDRAAPSQQARLGLNALTRGLPGARADQTDRTRVLLHLSQTIESLLIGQDSQAAAELERGLEAGLSHPAASFILGMLLNARDRQQALKHLTQAGKHPDFCLAAQLLIGRNYEDQGEHADAAAAYLQALRMADVELTPEGQRQELNERYETLSQNLVEQTSADEQKNICEVVRGLLLRPEWRAYLRTARQQMDEQSGGAIAAPLAEMLVQSRGGQVVELLASVRRLAARKMNRSAMEEAYFALQYAPTYLPLHAEMGELLFLDGHTRDAVHKFLLLANLYTLRGEAAQAVQLLERVTRLAPMELGVRAELVDLLAKQGRTDEAVRQAMDLAEFYYQVSDLENARQTYAAALRLPAAGKASRAVSAQILHRMADIDLQRFELRLALQSFEQICALQPDDAAARTSLVDVHSRLGQTDSALAAADAYVAYLESQNQRDKAAGFLEGLVSNQPGWVEARTRLANVYARVGNLERAVELLDRIADDLLDNQDRRGAMAVLERIVALNPPAVADYRAALEQLKQKR